MTFDAVWPRIDAFFSGLRRPTLTEEDGMPYRWLHPAGPRDQARHGSP
ncbi:hypothetical protein [Aureimonas jatrophae]|nr:hypothetical protein [Aureimonas jatrophae]MBB3952577.1 hypothetical protein [Aureimonas jatrophae]